MESGMTRFSWLFDRADPGPRPDWDKVLWETGNFAVLPSLGSLVPGWLIVVPRWPICNLSFLENDKHSELTNIVAAAREKLRVFSGNVQVFEHGGRSASDLSCGVDQAHLHIVPLDFDLAELAKCDQNISWSPITCGADMWNELPKDEEYLLVAGPTKALVGLPNVPKSQWFRRLIADRLGRGDQWNYRQYPHIENIAETCEKLIA